MAQSILLILVSIVLATTAQILLKTGMNQIGDLQMENGVIPLVVRLISTPAIIGGFACYGIGAVLWIIILSRVELSFAYPMLALMYVLIPIASKVFLHEEIHTGRLVGMVVVMIGVAIVGISGE